MSCKVVKLTMLLKHPGEYKGNSIRVLKDDKGEPWFEAKDPADILGYRDAYTACRYLAPDEKRIETRTRKECGTFQGSAPQTRSPPVSSPL